MLCCTCIVHCLFTLAGGTTTANCYKLNCQSKQILPYPHMSCCLLLAGSTLTFTQSYLESLGRMDTTHQVAGQTLLTKWPELTCLLCKHATANSSAFVKTAILQHYSTAYSYQQVVQLWKMSNCSANKSFYF